VNVTITELHSGAVAASAGSQEASGSGPVVAVLLPLPHAPNMSATIARAARVAAFLAPDRPGKPSIDTFMGICLIVNRVCQGY
jgi:hypothetical protein